MRDDADDAVYVTAVGALQGTAMDVKQMHSVCTDYQNIVGCRAKHGGNQGAATHCFGLDDSFLAAAPNVHASRVVDEHDLLVGLVDANLMKNSRDCVKHHNLLVNNRSRTAENLYLPAAFSVRLQTPLATSCCRNVRSLDTVYSAPSTTTHSLPMMPANGIKRQAAM